MDEIFNPSLLISAGPSSKTTLLYAKRLLSDMPEVFLDLIDFYDVQNTNEVSKDIQQIVDEKLLSAKALNRLVDIGYKVRSENISSVRLNLYIFWDLYENSTAALELVEKLSVLNYSNIDPSQHSGVSIFVLPILDKHWDMEEKHSSDAMKELKSLKDFLSKKENMLRMDSKIYLLHSIANDGTRVPKEELQHTSAVMAYLNVIPSKEPPLSSYNKRVLMHEGGYKLGTLGVTSLMVQKDKLEESFAQYLAERVVKHALSYESEAYFTGSRAERFTNSQDGYRDIVEKINCIDEEGSLKLPDTAEYNLELTKDISEYPILLQAWKNKISTQYILELKEKITGEVKIIAEAETSIFDEELDKVTSSCSIKEGLNYIDSVLNSLKDKNIKQKTISAPNSAEHQNRLKSMVEGFTNKTQIIIKAVLFAAVFSIVLIGLVIPSTSGSLRIISITALAFAGLTAVFLYYLYKIRSLNSFIEEYKNKILKVEGSALSFFITACILKEREALNSFILEKRMQITEDMEMFECAVKDLKPRSEDRLTGNLITELLDEADKERLYQESNMDVHELYKSFMSRVGGYKELAPENVRENLLLVAGSAAKLEHKDMFNYFKLKYKDNSAMVFSKWINTALIKSKQLLQFVNTNLEEHLILVASPEFLKILKQSEGDNIYNINFSPSASEHVNTCCIALARISLGLELENIITIRNSLIDKAAQQS